MLFRSIVTGLGSIKVFVSDTVASSTTASVNVIHNLGGVPQIVNWVLVNVTPEYDYDAGDEIHLVPNGQSDTGQAFKGGASSTNVWLSNTYGTAGENNNIYITRKAPLPGEGSLGAIAILKSHWQFKCYAIRLY